MCLHEYSSKRTIWDLFVCISPLRCERGLNSVIVRCLRGAFLCARFGCVRSGNQTELSALLRHHAFQIYFIHISALLVTFYEMYSKCMQAHDQNITVEMCSSTLLSMQQIHSDWISSQSFLPNIVLFLFVDENVNIFLSLFLSFEKSFYFAIISFSSVTKCRWRKLWRIFFVKKISTAWLTL